MVTKQRQRILPKNVARISLNTVQKLVKSYLECKGNLNWQPKIKFTKEKRFHCHPGYVLDPPSERYIERSNMWGPHEHMTVTHTFWAVIESQASYANKERLIQTAKVDIYIHFFKSRGGLICPSLIWIRKEEKNGPPQGPFPWGGKNYPIDYKDFDPHKPKKNW